MADAGPTDPTDRPPTSPARGLFLRGEERRAYLFEQQKKLQAAMHAYHAGVTLNESARRHGVTPSALWRYMARRGVSRRQWRRPLSGEVVAEIARRIGAGESVRALAAEYGFSRQTLYRALSQSGLMRLSAAAWRRMRRRARDLSIARQVMFFYYRGTPLKEIARTLRIHVRRVRRIVQSAADPEFAAVLGGLSPTVVLPRPWSTPTLPKEGDATDGDQGHEPTPQHAPDLPPDRGSGDDRVGDG